MIIPNSTKLGAHQIATLYETSAGISNSGEFNGYHHQIRLRKESDIPESAIAEAYLHEIIEGIKFFYNLSLNHGDLTVISEVLFQTIRGNKLNFNETEKI